MSKNIIALGVIAVLIIIAGYFAYTKYSNNSKSPTQTPPPTETPNPSTESSPSASTIDKIVVKINKTGFEPKITTIKAGQSVTWVNMDTKIRNVSSDSHPQHTAYPALNIGNIAASREASLTFTTKGSYAYHDHLQPTQKGTVVVE